MHLFVKRKREENLHQPLYVPASCPNDTPAAKKEGIAHAKEKMIIKEHYGTTSVMNPTNLLWYMMYVQTQPTKKCQKKMFCKIFHLSYPKYLELVEYVKNH